MYDNRQLIMRGAGVLRKTNFDKLILVTTPDWKLQKIRSFNINIIEGKEKGRRRDKIIVQFIFL